MVTCKLYGRMGNQMFQIAAVLGYARKHRIGYYFPKTTVNQTAYPMYFKGLPTNNREGIPKMTIKEKGHHYNDLPAPPLGMDVILDGYWQSEKYFDFWEEGVVDTFKLPYELFAGTVSIHVRRGDYLLYPDKHPAVNPIYLSVSFDYFRQKGYSKFLVFSDDPEWFKNFFRGFAPVSGCTFDYAEGNDELTDLSLMACCEHNIIANSSFSWWGAWLNRNPNKIVIAPRTWFGPGNKHLNSNDLLPEKWKKV